LASRSTQTPAPLDRLLFEQANDAILIFEPDSEIILEANPRACEMYGFARDEIVGVSLKRLTQVPRGEAQIRQLLRDGRCDAFETVHYRKDGSTLDIRVASSVVELEGRTAILSIHHDITDRKRAEEARLRNLVEQIPAVTYVAAGDEPRALYVSPQIEVLLGYEVREWLEDPEFFAKRLHPEDRGRVLAEAEKIRRTGEPHELEYRMVARDGRVVWFRDRAQLTRDAQGRVVSLQGVMIDTTGRKDVEAQLQAMLREKEILLHEVHHRVRNNLQLIHSLLNLQARRISDPEAAAAVRSTQDRVRLMASIHERLSESPDLAGIDFAAYLRSLVDLVFRTFRERTGPVLLDIEAEPASLPLHLAVPCGMIVHELVTNALQHAFAGRLGGRVRVELGRLERQVVLAVEDNGIGLPPGAEEGDSLGFTLVRALADQIGGRLVVHRGQGTRVEITFEAGGGEDGG